MRGILRPFIFIISLLLLFGAFAVFGQSDIKVPVSDAIQVVTYELLLSGDKKQAKSNLQNLLEIYPDSAAIRYNIAVISEALEDWDEAEKWFNEYLTLPKATPQRIAQAKIELENIAKIKSLTPKERDERSFKVALAKIEMLADNGKFSEALNLLKSYSATQRQNPEYIRFFERLNNGEKAQTYLAEFKTNFDAFSNKELFSRSAIIWDFLSPNEHPEIIFPLAAAVAKDREKPVVLDPRVTITPAGKCVSTNQPTTQTLFSVAKESIKYQGKTIYKLAPSERLLNSAVDGAKITLLLNNKILTIQNNQKTFLTIPESQSGRFFGKSTLYLHLADDKKRLFSLTDSGLMEYQIDASSILDIVEIEDSNIAVATNSTIEIFAPSGEKIATTFIPFQKISKISKGPRNSLLFITDKSLSKLNRTVSGDRISTLIIGTFSDLSSFGSEISATICAANQDKFEIAKISDSDIGEFNSDKSMAENLLKEIAKFNDLKAYDKSILRAIKIVERFPHSESSAMTVRYLLRKLAQ